MCSNIRKQKEQQVTFLKAFCGDPYTYYAGFIHRYFLSSNVRGRGESGALTTMWNQQSRIFIMKLSYWLYKMYCTFKILILFLFVMSGFEILVFLKFLSLSTWQLCSPKLRYWISRGTIMSLKDLLDWEHSFVHDKLK